MEDLNQVMINQPTINVGMIGSVSDGKSTITEKLTGIKTQKHSAETKRNITIKLGYANAKIFKCPKCPEPDCYQSFSSETMSPNCKRCNDSLILQKHISIVDCPGHNSLLSTMLNGTSVMDTTILVEAINNKPLPAPQTEEHIYASNLIGLKNSIICMNKLDLIKKDDAKNIINKFKDYLHSNNYNLFKNSPIVPIIANHNINIDIICQYLAKLEQPMRDLSDNVKLIIIRSFNVNKPNVKINDLIGGVIGGTIIRGILKLNDQIILYPGLVEKNKDNSTSRWIYRPIKSKILSINSENNKLEHAIPGGLLGIQLSIDPSFTAKDGLIGNILTLQTNTNNNLKVYENLYLYLELINNITLKKNDRIVINCNATNSNAEVKRIEYGKTQHKAELKLLDKPICVEIDDYVTLSIQKDGIIHLVGRGKIAGGIDATLKDK